MAYAALVSLTHVVEQILSDVRKYHLLCPEEKMSSLHENLIFLQEFLDQYPGKAGLIDGHLERRIRDVTYQLEDIIEYHVWCHCDSESSGVKNLFGSPAAFGSCTEEIESIVKETIKIKNNSRARIEGFPLLHGSFGSNGRRAMRRTLTVRKQNDAVGLDVDMNQIKERVAGQNPKLQIIPIVGMGGIGKTTLARNVYEDPLIEHYFHLRIWVTVSQNYDVQRILLEILPNKGLMERSVDLLMELVYKMLKGKRYLIVLDDTWHGEAWHYISKAFPDDRNGSRVILTTRLLDVAASVGRCSPVHRMQFLDGDQSWTLLQQEVFAKDSCPPRLTEIGKTIARNCKGLPLAIVVIAGLLKVNPTQDYWENIAKDVLAATATDDDQFIDVLSLSYENLPQHLKACFLYMGVFPEDFEIPISKLIKLWVAEGFMKRATSKILEEVAEEYLEDLVERSLVMVSKKRSNGRTRTCIIHDALRDLCLKKARQEKFLLNLTGLHKITAKILKTERRISISGYHNIVGIRSSPLRTFLCHGRDSVWWPSRMSFRLLRVLDGDYQLSDPIFRLFNLRYLALCTDSYTFSIPSSISNLQNLQTLIVNERPSSTLQALYLPIEIWKMPQLRHLISTSNTILPSPDSDGLPGTEYCVLDKLQTLFTLTNFKFSKDAIERLLNLKKLKIICMQDNPDNSSDFCLENLINLHQLEELNLYCSGIRTNFTFPKKLQKLTMTWCKIPWAKMSIVGSLPKLEVLKLKWNSFVGEKWEPIEGEFLALKYLKMELLDLKYWMAESTSFPRLETLSIHKCAQLREVQLSIGDIPTLQEVTMISCNAAAEVSVGLILEDQRSLGNDVLQVHIFTN